MNITKGTLIGTSLKSAATPTPTRPVPARCAPPAAVPAAPRSATRCEDTGRRPSGRCYRRRRTPRGAAPMATPPSPCGRLPFLVAAAEVDGAVVPVQRSRGHERARGERGKERRFLASAQRSAAAAACFRSSRPGTLALQDPAAADRFVIGGNRCASGYTEPLAGQAAVGRSAAGTLRESAPASATST